MEQKGERDPAIDPGRDDTNIEVTPNNKQIETYLTGLFFQSCSRFQQKGISKDQLRQELVTCLRFCQGIINHGKTTPKVYLIQGGCFFVLDRFSESLHAYREGLNLFPDDLDLRAGYKQVLEELTQKVTTSDYPLENPILLNEFWESILYSSARETIYYICLILIFLMGYYGYYSVGIYRKLSLFFAGILVCSLGVVEGVKIKNELNAMKRARENRAIVASKLDQKPIWPRLGNNESYPIAGTKTLAAGTEVLCLTQHGSWTQIRFQNQRAWLPNSDLLFIERKK